MKKTRGQRFMVMVLAVLVAAALTVYEKADAQWEAQWQKTLEAGKKEGRVAVYASMLSSFVRQQAPTFKKRFGIEVEVTAGRAGDLSEKLRKERSAGMDLADLILSGGNTMVSVKKMGITEPMDARLMLPEVTDPRLWYTQDRLPWFDDAKHLFPFYAYPNRDISINTDLVKPGEITSWQDLLKPRYKGKIIWSDPTVFGSGFNGFCTNIIHKVTDEDYYRKLVAGQDITLARNQRQMATWLAKGKYAVAVSVQGRPIAEMLNAGAHIAHVAVKEGTYLSYDGGVLGVAVKAPHPNAARVFINWLLGKEGQIFAQKATRYMSARNDIPTEDVNPENRRVPGERYFIGANSMEKWLEEEQDQYLALAKKIFGPLIRR